MKHYRELKISVIFLSIFIAIIFISCDLFIIPMAARTNPNDQNTTIQPVEWVSISGGFDDEVFGVNIDWLWTDNDKPSEVIGFAIIRKAGSAPQSVYDGYFVNYINNTESSYYFDPVDSNPDYPKGYTIYYAVFSYAPKWDESEMNEDEKLSIDENWNVQNLQNYNFNGPVFSSMEVWDQVDMPVAADAYVDNDGAYPDASVLIVSSDAATPGAQLSYIEFDLSNQPAGELRDIYLILRTTENAPDGNIIIAPLKTDWLVDNSRTTLSSVEAVNSDYSIELNISGGPFVRQWVNVTDIYNAWIAETIPNYGFRLMREELGNYSVQFFSSEDGDPDNNMPLLRVFFMNE